MKDKDSEFSEIERLIESGCPRHQAVNIASEKGSYKKEISKPFGGYKKGPDKGDKY